MSTDQTHKVYPKKKLSVWLSLVFLAIAALSAVFLTRSYPKALVGGNYISARQMDQNFDIARRLDPKADKQKVAAQFYNNAKKQKLAKDADVEAELKFYKTARMQEYSEFLRDYFEGKESLFKKYVVEPRAYDAALAIKYYSDFSKNNDAYNKANNIISRLSSGQTFEELARIYSDDKVSGQLGGDLGFAAEGQLMPELEKAMKNSTVGEVRKELVVSRLGYHILYPVETADKDGQKVWHVKHILITSAGYESWLSQQLSGVKIINFFN